MRFLRCSALAIIFAGIAALFLSGGAEAVSLPASIVYETYGEVVETGKIDRVVLYAKYPTKGFYAREIYLEVRDGESDRLLFTAAPSVRAGYKPTLLLGKFSDHRLSDVYLGIDSGGNGGYRYSYVFSFQGGIAKTIWNFEDWKSSVSAEYLDSYRFRLTDGSDGTRWTADISDRGEEYLKEIYDGEGRLLRKKEGMTFGYLSALPVYEPSIDRFELIVSEGVSGLCHADAFGYFETLLRFDDGSFKPTFKSFNMIGSLENS